MFLWWTTLLFVLGMFVGAPLPGRIRAFALFALAATAWLLWGLYGVEYIADLKWPTGAVEKGCAACENHGLGEKVPSENRDGPTARLGQVGDLFGGANALFAALAFAGVGIAAYQQWKTTQIAFKQAIEATFFSALEQHHKIIDDLRFNRDQVFPANYNNIKWVRSVSGMQEPKPKPAVVGREVFSEVLSGISYAETGPSTYQTTIDNYELLQAKHNYVLGHYFRNLYQILKLIDRDEALDKSGKQKYASMLRAQLSSDELATLMVNCAGTMVDHGEFRVFLVRYRILEHAPLKKDGREYVHAGMSQRVVLADEHAIKEYISEPHVPPKINRYRGAFGSNPWV